MPKIAVINHAGRSRLWRGTKVILVCFVLLLGSAATQEESRTTGSAKARVEVPSHFDPERLHEARLKVDPADWTTLLDNKLKNDYYVADLTIDGERLPRVGIRVRGYGSRKYCYKPSLRLDMNRYVDFQDFHGHTSLVLDNQSQDPTFMRERLAFIVFQAMDFAAPLQSYARVWVNDEYLGLYTLTEPVDRLFLQKRFGESGGNLFDYESNGWAWDFSWRGESRAAYIPDPFVPKTNKTTLDPTALIAFVRAINQSPDETYVSDLSRSIDPGRFLTYVAIENAIAEQDGIVGDWSLANFYLYQFAGTSRFEFIPWDKDFCFRKGSWPLYRRIKRNVLTRRLIRIREQNEFYISTLKRIVTTYVNERWLLPRLEEAYRQTRAAARADFRKTFTNEVYEKEVENLRQVIRERERDVFKQLGLSVDR
jgi:spore coat protein CotH